MVKRPHDTCLLIGLLRSIKEVDYQSVIFFIRNHKWSFEILDYHANARTPPLYCHPSLLAPSRWEERERGRGMNGGKMRWKYATGHLIRGPLWIGAQPLKWITQSLFKLTGHQLEGVSRLSASVVRPGQGNGIGGADWWHHFGEAKLVNHRNFLLSSRYEMCGIQEQNWRSIMH